MSRLSRRAVVAGLAAAPVAGFSTIARANAPGNLPPLKVVKLKNTYEPGSVVVATGSRKLYFVLPDGRGIEYPCAVGRPDKQWFGKLTMSGKHVRPAWSPPDEIRRDNPRLPDVIPSGAPNNPMGERAITLSPGEYAVHGTNRPDSIGNPASYGCIRMHNHDIVDLYERVTVGAPIIAVK